MNNTRYMEWMNDLLPSSFHQGHNISEFTIFYHAEALEGEVLDVNYEMKEGGILQVDAWRSEASDNAMHNRIFSAQVQFE